MNNIYHSIILARGGSKGIKDKNLKKINHKTLLFWSIEQSLKSKKIKKTWVSSDSEKILKYAKSIGAETIKNPKVYLQIILRQNRGGFTQ
jgi:CMP-N,N'-diacetyllegionaminic acid synthase